MTREHYIERGQGVSSIPDIQNNFIAWTECGDESCQSPELRQERQGQTSLPTRAWFAGWPRCQPADACSVLSCRSRCGEPTQDFRNQFWSTRADLSFTANSPWQSCRILLNTAIFITRRSHPREGFP